jgi:2-oxoglutarate ferredoxin oxidoreductase subunit beta
MGSIDYPFNPISVALGSNASFVARSIDVEARHLQSVIRRAHAHNGAAFVEILQNCNIFNDGAFESLTDKEAKADTQLLLEHGKPLVFGKDRDRGLRMRGHSLEAVRAADAVGEDSFLMHDETDLGLAFLLSQIAEPGFPTPVGVFRAVDRPTYESLMADQVGDAKKRWGHGNVDALLKHGDTWTVA